jgi:hypothetical protein
VPRKRPFGWYRLAVLAVVLTLALFGVLQLEA